MQWENNYIRLEGGNGGWQSTYQTMGMGGRGAPRKERERSEGSEKYFRGH